MLQVRIRARLAATFAIGALTLIASSAFSGTAFANTLLVPFSQFGGDVDLTTESEYCLENSADTCLANTGTAALGASAGRFGNPQSVAIDQATGDVYVAEGLNQRVQKLASNGEFLAMFGMSVLTAGTTGEGTLTENSNVITSVVTTSRVFALGQTITGAGIQSGTTITAVGSKTITLSKPPTVTGVVAGVPLTVKAASNGVSVNERQTVTITGAPTEGNFSLSYKTPNPSLSEATTAGIAFNATAVEVKAALEALSNMSAVGGEVAVTGATGGPYTIEFKGARYADTNVEQLKASASLGGGTSPAIVVGTTVQGDGAPADDVCTKAQQAECEVGFAGGPSVGLRASELSGQFNGPDGVAVDNSCYEAKLTETTVPTCAATYPANGNVFVEDRFNNRVQELTPSGEFVAMIGGEVNKTAVERGGSESERNLCTEAEAKSAAKVECGRGIENEVARSAPEGQFSSWPAGLGNLLSVGLNAKTSPAEDLLYVGDEARVQEFDAATGHWKRNLSLASLSETGKVQALTVDHSGDAYISVQGVAGVHVYEPGSDGSTQLSPFEGNSRLLTTKLVRSLARDPVGHIAVVEGTMGSLFSATGRLQSSFGAGFVEGGIAFDDTSKDLYTGKSSVRKLTVFSPRIAPEALTGIATLVGARTATLNGEVEPEGLAASSLFEYGACPTHYSDVSPCSGSYGMTIATTPANELAGETNVAVHADLSNLLPNQAYHYRIVAENANGIVQGSEAVFASHPVPPAIEATPQASFVSSQSADLTGALNPENALGDHYFEYVAQTEFEKSGWAAASKTSEVNTAAYVDGNVFTSEEVRDLTPGTTYHIRLFAENEYHEKTEGPETTFTTGAAPQPSAQTGGYADLGSTSATITATVNPEGVPASYAFELGVYEGEKTQYGVVFAGSPGTGTTPVGEELGLTGLQPGTTYAYRVSVTSGYLADHTRYGATVTFTTPGLPAAIGAPSALALLPVPAVKFPSAAKVSRPSRAKCAKGRRRNKRGVCVKLKRKKRRRH